MTVTTDTLDELVAGAREGDPDAFGRLFERYHGSIYGLLLRQTRSVALAEDLASETFFRALRGIETFTSDPEYFGPWLVRIARNLTSDHFKSSRTRYERVTDDMTPHEGAVDGPDSWVLGTLDTELLSRSMRLLPVNQRRCVALRFLHQRSVAETADLLGCSVGAVKQLQLRALRNLARSIRAERYDDLPSGRP